MNTPDDANPPGKGHLLIYPTEDGQTKIEVRLENKTVWLTQQHMGELFQTTQQNISLHLQNIYQEGELKPEATNTEFLSVRQEGNRQVKRPIDFYNLDAIISVGYRVKSVVATRFRIWATQKLREFIVADFENMHTGFTRPTSPPFPNPNGIGFISPGLERGDYPGWAWVEGTTPTGLRQINRTKRRNPVGVGDLGGTFSQGSSCLATVASAGE